MDGRISDDQFGSIVDEVSTTWWKPISGATKAHVKIQLDQKTKNVLIQQGRDEVRASFVKELGGTS